MQLLSFICSAVGAVLGWALGKGFGLVSGLAIGYLIGELHGSNRRLRGLEKKVAELDSRLETGSIADSEAQAKPSVRQPDPFPGTYETEAAPVEIELDLPDAPPVEESAFVSTGAVPSAAPDAVSGARNEAHGDAPAGSSPKPAFWNRYLRTGNLVVRAGVIILFFGIAFLVKYAADRDLLPIEFRLAGIALAGMCMIGIGWKLGLKRIGYALALQGGGIGVLYLTVFGAARIYGLVSPLFAFAVMVVLVALSAVLAVLQDARSLSVLGATGGFLAPVLISSDTGSHVVLFSYYLLLNSGILGVAWFKSWRELNLTGFIFTFGIGAFWGLQYYQPRYFFTTEPFLIAHFLMYFMVAVLYAFRQPSDRKGYVNGTLIFGLPLAVFGLQSGLVRDMEYGLTVSAVAMAAVYILGAAVLWRRAREYMRFLAESFLALGVMFATVAVPLATDGYWTAATWSLEGAALVWVGVRQHRTLARVCGFFLQIGAGVAALYGFDAEEPAMLSTSGVLISLAGLFSSYYAERFQSRLKSWEHRIHLPLLVWGLAWWFGTGVHDIQRLSYYPHDWQIIGIFTATSLGFMGWLALRLDWSSLRYPAMTLMPLMVGFASFHFFGLWPDHPLQSYGWVLWPLAFAAAYGLLWLYEGKWDSRLEKNWHLLGLWLLVFLLTWEFAWIVGQVIPESETWMQVAWGAVSALAVLVLLIFGDRLPWPVKPFYPREGAGVLVAYLLVWCLAACALEGNPAPLPYIPIFNPVDLMLGFIVLLTGSWFLRNRGNIRIGRAPISDVAVTAIVGGVAFLALNAALARTVHFWGGVPYRVHDLGQSFLFQSALSVLWSLLAMGIMGLSAWKQRRETWFVGAGLLAVVVLKLFAVDLSGTGTVARIVSFIAVGVLMLVIGYVSPLPPQNQEEPVS